MEIINFQSLIEKQKSERYRSLILYGPPLYNKTTFVKNLCSQIDATYHDLLQHINNTDWKSAIDLFTVQEFKGYLLSLCSEQQVIFIDQMDFLWHVWTTTDKSEFVTFVEKLNNTETNKVFCFVLQEDEMINEINWKNHFGNKRCVSIATVQSI